MKKKQRMIVLLGMLFLLFFPIGVQAALVTTEEDPAAVLTVSMSVPDTSLGIEYDKQSWRVLTRASLEEELLEEEYGLTQETAKQWMEKNYIYLYGVFDAEGVYPHMEFLVRKSEAVNVTDLSKYSNRDIRALGKELAGDRKDARYDVFETDHKYAFLAYTDSGYIVWEYYTVVNGESYTFTFQKMSDFTQEEITQIQKIMDSAVFTIRTDLGGIKEGGRRISAFTIVGFALLVFLLWRMLVKNKQNSKEEKFLREIEELERKCLEDREKQDKFEQN